MGPWAFAMSYTLNLLIDINFPVFNFFASREMYMCVWAKMPTGDNIDGMYQHI